MGGGAGRLKETPGRGCARPRQGSSLAGGMLVTTHPKTIPAGAWLAGSAHDSKKSPAG